MESTFDNERAFRELCSRMEQLNKKLDKAINLQTKIAKVLHLIPVTEKEEREFQLRKRENAEIVAKVTSQLMEMAPKDPEKERLVLPSIQDLTVGAFSDVLGDDYLTEKRM